MLKLNESKTEAMLVGPKTRLQRFDKDNISVCLASITFATSVKNLGVFLESDLSMESLRTM